MYCVSLGQCSLSETPLAHQNNRKRQEMHLALSEGEQINVSFVTYIALGVSFLLSLFYWEKQNTERQASKPFTKTLMQNEKGQHFFFQIHSFCKPATNNFKPATNCTAAEGSLGPTFGDQRLTPHIHRAHNH